MKLPGVDLETRGMYALLVDRLRGPLQALPIYKSYLADGGNEPRVLSRLKEIEDAIASHNEKLKALGLPEIDTSKQAAVAVAPQPDPNLTQSNGAKPAPGKSGLEARGWAAEDVQWSLPVDAKVMPLPAEEGGQKVLSVTSTGKLAAPPAEGQRVPDKVAIKKGITYAVDENAVLSFMVRNRTQHPLQLAVAVKTSDKWDFYESLQQTIPPSDDFKEVRFNLKANTFKSSATKWANTGAISNLDQVKEIQVLIYNHSADVDLLIQGMGFVKDTEM
jgi:hypothetical protein